MATTDVVLRINELNEISQSVRDFLQDEYWNIDEDIRSMVEPIDILCGCIERAMTDLEEYGLTFTGELDSFLTDTYRNKCIDILLDSCSPESLIEFINGLSRSELEYFGESIIGRKINSLTILQDTTEIEDGLTFDTFINTIMHKHKNTDTLTLVKYYSYDWMLNDNFKHYILDVLITALNTIKDTDEDMQELKLAYIKNTYDHITTFKKTCTDILNNKLPEQIVKKYGQLDQDSLIRDMAEHDIDLLNFDNIDELALFWAVRNNKDGKYDEKIINDMKHHRKVHLVSNKHHIEYHIERKDELKFELSLNDSIQIVANFYKKQSTKAQFLTDVRNEIERVDVPVDVCNKLLEIANLVVI